MSQSITCKQFDDILKNFVNGGTNYSYENKIFPYA